MVMNSGFDYNAFNSIELRILRRLSPSDFNPCILFDFLF